MRQGRNEGWGIQNRSSGEQNHGTTLPVCLVYIDPSETPQSQPGNEAELLTVKDTSLPHQLFCCNINCNHLCSCHTHPSLLKYKTLRDYTFCKPSAGGMNVSSWIFQHELFIFNFLCSLTWPAYLSYLRVLNTPQGGNTAQHISLPWLLLAERMKKWKTVFPPSFSLQVWSVLLFVIDNNNSNNNIFNILLYH